MNTLEEATQVKVEEGIRLIKHWLANGRSLAFAVSQFNSCSTLGPKLRQQVYEAVGFVGKV